MDGIDYVSLVKEIVKPLVSHPEDVNVKQIAFEDATAKLEVSVHSDDLGRVIGKKGRTAGAIRTIAHAAAIRYKQNVEIEFLTNE